MVQSLRTGQSCRWDLSGRDEVGHLNVISDNEPSTLRVELFRGGDIVGHGPARVETGADLHDQAVPKGCRTLVTLRNLGPTETRVDVVWIPGEGSKFVIAPLFGDEAVGPNPSATSAD